MKRRVVVTGLGLVTPLGPSVRSSWERILQGHSGLTTLPDNLAEQHSLPCNVCASVDAAYITENQSQWVTNSKTQSVGFISFALKAAQEALLDAEWPPKSDQFDPTR